MDLSASLAPFGLLAVAAVTLLASPHALAQRTWIVRFPRLALAAWVATAAVGILSALGGLVWWIVAHARVDAANGSGAEVAAFLSAWIAGALASGAVAAVALRAVTASHEHGHDLADLRTVLAACTSRQTVVGGRTVLVVATRRTFAAGVPGTDPLVVLSEPVLASLEPDELSAVVEHEAAHLSLGHGRLLHLARVHQACVPGLRAPREMRRAVDLLVELVADDRAARACGVAPLASALTKLGGACHDDTMPLRAARLEQRAAAHAA